MSSSIPCILWVTFSSRVSSDARTTSALTKAHASVATACAFGATVKNPPAGAGPKESPDVEALPDVRSHFPVSDPL